ncbi:MAG TPA: isoprenyl transferase [Acidobacteriota bacterium]|nr:isoprenyl transferase [Acidobacteriota bacterium]HNT18416.1 isoprenyl transferase [Acidobacteriota bacterium]HPA27044.1 isoprenyl transferase [Acidobacteriota bacterium]HQO20635.1 isoprenyl transferase [Acidobacteriota bacterium]HQQ47471.1 isoprenyl transferase [Acidobacteriota bacterium]
MPEPRDAAKQPHPLAGLLDRRKLPRHVAIIMDGNGRWAKARGLARIEGHKSGINAVKAAVEAAEEIGIPYLTLYAFSVENWKRPETEVRALFKLLEHYLDREKKKLEGGKIRFRTIGRTADLPPRVRSRLKDLSLKTGKVEGLTLTLALSYGGRSEIADAVKTMVEDARHGKLDREINEETVQKYLYAPDLPDADLLIRTSGEYRISNFLLWQVAYAELMILDTLWPDFTKDHFYEAILDYQRRERRYGGIVDQD